MARHLDLGLCFHREAAASTVIEVARAAEEVGFDEFWVIEDCFYTAGISLATAALTATERIGVGLGIMPAVARQPAITAMEVATVANLAPGRFHAGIGHGMREWMEQMGAWPDSPLTTLGETITVVRRLLTGDEVTVRGKVVTLDAVRLDAPPEPVPLVSAGVRGPKSLALSGAVADGTILADWVSPEYVRWARERIDEGSEGGEHRLTVFANVAVADNGDAVREALAPQLAAACAEDPPPSLRAAPFFEELSARADDVGWQAAIAAMPPEWWSRIGPIGSPDDAAAYLNGLAEAGVDAVAMFPHPADPVGDAHLLAEAVLPLVT
ncbi:MAG: LLM class flavin-dependent oxidoreductase [Actinomycetota bacterium]